MIEKIIHQIWIQGRDNLPSKYHNCVNTWLSLEDSAYKYYFWDNNSIINILDLLPENLKKIKDFYLSTSRYDQKADIARICLLYIFGGYYIDVDIERKSCKFTNLGSSNVDLIFMRSPIDLIYNFTLQNAFCASIKNHNFTKYTIMEMCNKIHPKNEDQGTWFNISNNTGSKLLYNIINKYSENEKWKIKYLTYPDVVFQFAENEGYLLDKPNSQTLFIIKQYINSDPNNGFIKAAIFYSKIRKFIPLIIFVILIYLFYKFKNINSINIK
jgi:mannosyltransferase OCH1-like enzyme